MESCGSVRYPPGRMTLAQLFGPLTIPTSALDFKDKVKITIKCNAGVKCLKVSKPCDTSAVLPCGGRKEPKSCDILKISLPGPTTSFEGATAKPKLYLKMSPSGLSENKTEEPKPTDMKREGLACEAGRSSTTMHDVSTQIKKEPNECDPPGGAWGLGTHIGEEPFPRSGTKTEATQTTHNYPSEEFLRDISAHIKEEPLTDEEEPSDNTSLNIKKEPVSDGEEDNVAEDQPSNIKEEPLSDKEDDPSNIDEKQILTIKIKEEPTSSKEESDVEDGQMNHIGGESCSPQARGPSTSKIWLSSHGKDNISCRSLPPVICNPLRMEKMALPKETKAGLLKKLMEFGAPTHEKIQESDVEDGQMNRIGGESCSPQAGGPSTSKIWLSSHRKDNISCRSLPPVICNPPRMEEEMTLPKETKAGLLKKLMELGAPAHEEIRTLTYTPVKMYQCSKCGRYFTSRQHLQRHHQAHQKYKVACPDCGRLFACKATALRHQVVHSKVKPFPCSSCKKSFSTDKGREIHQRRHASDKPFPCPDCGKTFLFKAQLATHQMIHTGERYACDECGRCYRTKPGLVLHTRVHRGDLPYFCPECGKGFVHTSNLKSHLRTHSMERPFVCPQCGKGFRQKYNLNQHMRVHATKERERYSCSECGKSYKRTADYRWHMLIHLGEK